MPTFQAQRLDTAFEDRFIKVRLDYLSPAEEADLILDRYPQVSKEAAGALTKVAEILQLGTEGDSLRFPVSTRQVLDAAAYLPLGYRLNEIIEKVILTEFISFTGKRHWPAPWFKPYNGF